MNKLYRLLKNEQFKKIINQGKKVKNHSCTIFYLKSDFLVGRVGISVSTKIGNAVTRNKIKRRLKEIIYNIFDFAYCIDLVIIAKSAILEKSFLELKSDLEKLISSIIKTEEN